MLLLSGAPDPAHESEGALPASPGWTDPLFLFLGGAGLAMTAGVFALARLGGVRGAALVALLLGLCGAIGTFGCVCALGRSGGAWNRRARAGWTGITVAGALFCLACFALAFSHRTPGAHLPSLSDWFFMAQQALLAAGLFALAWRGKSLGLMRLLSDTLIVALAALVLLWSFVLKQRLESGAAPLVKAFVIFSPLFDTALLFCALMLLGQARECAGLARASWFLLAGVSCQAASHWLWTTHSVKGYGHPPLSDALCGWSFLLIGLGALLHARHPLEAPADATSEDDRNDGQNPHDSEIAGHADATRQRLKRWHGVAMLWLPYAVTLGASCVLIAQELKHSNGDTLRRVLPVLVLLLAIAARQMIALWDNLQLAEKLRASNAFLERNVGERTRHLATLHGITSTLNTSLDRRTVLRVTLEKTIAVTGADAGGIWLREARRDVYEGSAPQHEWILMHWQGDDDPAMPSLLRDLAIAEASEGDAIEGDHFHLSPATREAMQAGVAPPRQRLILVPVRSQGILLGAMGLMRSEGAFTYEDRALVESVALEAGTALQNARMYSEAAHRADRDSVTDLFNHRAVQEQMTATLSRCKRVGGTFSIVMMDLNNFKFFNDTYGHPVGDDVLRTVARGLRESCRSSDILGRYGGDEFIVVLPDTDASGTLDVCARINAALDAKHFEPVPGTRLPIGTAFGWAAYPQDGENIMDLLSAADANLYNHKRGGASYISQTQKELQENRDEMKKLKSRAHGGSFGVLDALVTAIDNKDHYTRHHSEEVTYLSLLVARELGYSKEQLEAVRISGLLHDVGKIAVPDSILRHPGKLGRDEWDIMQQHPVFGALIVKDVPQLEPVLDGIKYHHEKWDGTGYPEKLGEEAIPEMGRLLAMGDCYSALTTDRPYRKGWKPEAALEEIERCSGTQFDPRLCAVFLEVMRRELLVGGDTRDYGSRIAEEFIAEPGKIVTRA
jgi:diguanylate cyclase (GGDEF)-like protein/putative nucleotidyltransferase with HDIG domain